MRREELEGIDLGEKPWMAAVAPVSAVGRILIALIFVRTNSPILLPPRRQWPRGRTFLPSRRRADSDSLRTARLCPIYQATRGNWVLGSVGLEME
jgi:hypothetical protein